MIVHRTIGRACPLPVERSFANLVRFVLRPKQLTPQQPTSKDTVLSGSDCPLKLLAQEDCSQSASRHLLDLLMHVGPKKFEPVMGPNQG
jgi:hypothetical protein